MKRKSYFNWSSGKDSALALYKALQSDRYEVVALFTTINSVNDTIPMHGVSHGLLQKQAQSIGIPLVVLDFAVDGPAGAYEAGMQKAVDAFKRQGVDTALFGDIHLEELKNQRVRNCSKAGMEAGFPLWGMAPAEVMEAFIGLGFKAITTSVDGAILDERFVGRVIDRQFLADLPPEADPCGENGEYHSFVFDGPLFARPVDFRRGDVYYREYPNDGPEDASGCAKAPHRFWYADLLQ